MDKKDLQAMYNRWVANCQQAVETTVPPLMKEVMKEAIEIEVYAKYIPIAYERRQDNGGLTDKENMDYEVELEGSKIKIIMYNTTRREKGQPEFIDSVIVTGQGYQWNSSIKKAQMPRDFYKVAQEIIDSEEFRIKIKRKLKFRNYKII